MASPTFATATTFQHILIIEEALEKVLDRGPEMSVESFASGEPMHVFVVSRPWSDERTAYDIHQIARELEALLS